MRRFAVFFTSFSLILLLASCMTQQSTTRITSDASGTNEIILGYTHEVIQELGENPYDELQGTEHNQPWQWNTEIVPWEDDTYAGTKIMMRFTDLDMMVAQLNRFIGTDEETGEGMFKAFTVERNGDSFVIQTVLEQTEEDDAFSGSKVTMTFEMPRVESITLHEFATLEDDRVVWDIPIGRIGTYEFELHGSLQGAMNWYSEESPDLPFREREPENIFKVSP